jgi:hypothetical protein
MPSPRPETLRDPLGDRPGGTVLACATRIDISVAGNDDNVEELGGLAAAELGGLAHDISLFGSPADRVGPVALCPRLTSGLPLSTSEARRRGQYLPQPGSVCITHSADPGPIKPDLQI